MNPDRPITLAIPAAGPLFEGHFPGRPILPAVGLLDLALRALALRAPVTAGAAPALCGIVSLRLRRLVTPGETLDLLVQAPAPDGRTRLEVRRAADVVAQAVVVLGAPSLQSGAGSGVGPGSGAAASLSGSRSHAEAAAHARAPRPSPAAPDLDDLLPQRPPMRLVEGVESATDDGVVCVVRVPERSAFDDAGTAPSFVALEMAAQAAAASEALRRFRQGGAAGAQVGYLVGARDVSFARARVPVGETLLASVRLSGIALPLCTYVFEVTLKGKARAGEIVASGSLSTWLTATDA